MIVGFCICMPCGILAVALKNLPFAMEHARLPLILHYTHMFFMVRQGEQGGVGGLPWSTLSCPSHTCSSW